jgi:hypothetical protein
MSYGFRCEYRASDVTLVCDFVGELVHRDFLRARGLSDLTCIIMATACVYFCLP